MTEQRAGRRRALADLLPATLATGLAGVVVSLLVGGTTAGLHTALSDGARAVDPPTYVGDEAGVATSPDGVTVRVRPGRPGPAAVAVAPAFDLAAPAVIATVPAPGAGGSAAGRRGSPLTAAAAFPPGSVAPALEPAAVVLDAVVEATPLADPVAAAPKPKAGSKGRNKHAVAPAQVAAASGDGRVALDGGGDDRVEPSAERRADQRRGRPDDVPPPHAPAHGRR